jgi:hypothetical protein
MILGRLDIFWDYIVSGFGHGIEGELLTHNTDAMEYADRGVIAKGTKYVPHLSVRSESGRFAVDIARFDCDKEDGLVAHCNTVGDGEIDSRHVRTFDRRGICRLNNIMLKISNAPDKIRCDNIVERCLGVECVFLSPIPG